MQESAPDPARSADRCDKPRISVFDSPAACEALWRQCAANGAAFVFQSYEWQATWQATIGTAEGVTPCIVHVADGAGRSLLLPLGIYRFRGMRVLRGLGGVVTDYSAPVIDAGLAARLDPPQVAELWTEIRSRLPKVDVVWLQRMPQTIDEVVNPLILLPKATHAENASAALLPATMAEFRAAHKVDWPDSRRRRRRLAERGRCEFEIAQTPAAKAAILRELAVLKSRHWRRTRSRDLFAEPGYLDFYRTLSLTDQLPAEVHVSCLRVDGQIVAAHWGVVHRGRFYHLLPDYDREWGRYAVGRLLIEHLVEWCIAEPAIGIFDFTAGAEPYKREWTDQSQPLYELLAAQSLKGWVFVAARRLKERLKRQRRFRNVVRRAKRRPPL